MSVLSRICEDKKEHIRLRKKKTSFSTLEDKIKDIPATRGFKSKIFSFVHQEKAALIAEVKKASPSRGVIREDFDPVEIARAYTEGGAACLSVLTDEPYFQGHDEYLQAVRAACDLPLLRKDFMLDPYQVYETRALGADCILLIIAALDDGQTHELYSAARELGLDCLVEVHDRRELDRALELETGLIGVNNRNLKTLDVDLQTSVDLAAHFPDDAIKISESGIYSHDDIAVLQRLGYAGFLVGESLMRQSDIRQAVKALLGEQA